VGRRSGAQQDLLRHPFQPGERGARLTQIEQCDVVRTWTTISQCIAIVTFNCTRYMSEARPDKLLERII
jgi:hypothetical protein